MTLKPKWDAKSVGEYERSLTLRDIKVEDDDDIQDHKKPWVGLTDEEIADLLDVVDHYNFPEDLIVYTQAKLKEKNT